MATGPNQRTADHRIAAHSPAVAYLATALCLLGLGLAGYLTYEHYTSSTSLSCPATAAINCVKVTTSSYSTFLGIPVALGGLLYYTAMTVLCQPFAWRPELQWIRRIRLIASATGLLAVFYLVWAELFEINAICLWCTGVHIVTFLLFVTLTFEYAAHPPDTSAVKHR